MTLFIPIALIAAVGLAWLVDHLRKRKADLREIDPSETSKNDHNLPKAA